MKNYLLSFLILTSFFACKKGQEDPSFSLRTRKARLAGEWKVKSKQDDSQVTQTSKTTLADNSVIGPNTSEYSINESWKNGTYSFSQIVPNSLPDTNYGGTVSTFNYIIKKDGTWSSELAFDYTVNIDLQGGNIKVTYYIKSEGVWNFMGKDQPNTKNKELVSLSAITKTTVKTTVYHNYNSAIDKTKTETIKEEFEPNETIEIWKLIALKNKELKAEINNKPKRNIVTKNETSPGSSQYDITEVNEVTDQKITIILQQE